MELSPQQAYTELSYYTLGSGNPDFIHQNIVDAFAAQTADRTTKPVKIVFALIGLYLYLEKGYTGRHVQKAHMELAGTRKEWPDLPLPQERGAITVYDALEANPGPERDAMIRRWCESVWQAYAPLHARISALVSAQAR